jgi:hypothetical protein
LRTAAPERRPHSAPDLLPVAYPRSRGLATIGSPTAAALIALDLTGLVLLDAHPTQTRATRLQPGRCHDALAPLGAVCRVTGRLLASFKSETHDRCYPDRPSTARVQDGGGGLRLAPSVPQSAPERRRRI